MTSETEIPPKTEIPVLDMGPYLADKPDALEALAAQLRHVQENVGFYFIVNHGVRKTLISGAYDALRQFFALPDIEKQKVRLNPQRIGYVPAKSSVYVTSNVNENTKPDLNEVIMYVRDRASDHPELVNERSFHGPNQWLDEETLPGFRDSLTDYYAAIETLGHKMLAVYARALDLPADYFDPFFKDPMWTTRNAFYPGSLKAEQNQFGISPHRDHGFITFLPLSEEPGLQIQTPTGDWIAAEQVENAIIVNTGEFMNRWTNGRFIATPHRVLLPRNDRYSIALFFNPTWDTEAVPLETCVSENNPAKFEPINIHDYLDWYINKNFNKDGGGQQDASDT
jgi:isopenicillin N synthase-like dioxygenase